MTPAAVSVVIPLHDGARTITETLDSVQRQTRPVDEVIVVDDGSADGGAEIAAGHALHPRVIRLPDACGAGFARNTGMAEARGRWVGVLDQDDLWLPWHLASLLAAAAAHPECRLLVATERGFAAEEDRDALRDHPFRSMIELWCRGDEVRSLLDLPATSGPEPRTSAISRQRILQGSVTVTTSYLLDRTLAMRVGGFAGWLRSADDWILLQAMSAHTEPRRVEGASVLYRVHPANSSLTTDWPMPLLTAAAAARFGGTVVGRGEARDRAVVGPLGDSAMLMHVMRARAATRTPRALLDTAATVQLLATDAADRRAVLRGLARAAVSARLPGAVRRLSARPRRERR